MLKEDLALVKQANQIRKLYSHPHSPEELQKLFRGKLFSIFMVSGPTAFLGLAIAGVLQAVTRSPWVGLFASILLVFVVTTTAFQILWYADNKNVYRVNGRFRKNSFVAMQQDLMPLHIFGLKTAATFALVAVPINAVIIGAVQIANAQAANSLPVPLMVFILDTILVQGTFMRIMGNFFDRHSVMLAKRHFELLSAPASVE